MSIERLTAEDETMLWPDEIWPQDIGALAVLDGTNLLDEDGRFRIEAVREAVAARLHLVPRFRQLLHVPPRRLGGPLWVDAPAFELAGHLGVVPLEAPGSEAQFLLAVEQLRRRRLDQSRPLWEMWFLPGLPQGRVGWFVRMHHTIGDGIAGVATIGAFLDTAAAAPVVAPPGPPWVPAPFPTPADLAGDNLRRRVAWLGRAPSLLGHPLSTVRHVLAAWPAMRELLTEGPLPATSLDRVIGPDRNLALIRSSLDLVKDVAHASDATVNDVLLAVTAGGIRALLRNRGEPIDGVVLRIYVPVSLRHGEYSGAQGNRIGQMVVPLPIGLSDPRRRLRYIASETARRKAESRPSLGILPSRGLAGRAFLKLLNRHRVNVTTANIPGPEIPFYLAGARLLEVFPLVNLIGWVSFGVAAMSYAGQFNLMVVADRDMYPDLEVFAAGVRDELGALAESRPTMPVR
jgi:WS/DGAT/MGAT family acyltransferase